MQSILTAPGYRTFFNKKSRSLFPVMFKFLWALQATLHKASLANKLRGGSMKSEFNRLRVTFDARIVLLLVVLILVLKNTDCSAKCEPFSPINASCNYYSECLEDRVRCSDEGYALGYGYKYCQRFLSIGTVNSFEGLQLSPAGLKWRTRTLKCLQDQLISKETELVTCNSIRDFAFASHIGCYTDPASSICDLPLSDEIAIGRVVDIKEYTDIDGLKQLFKVGIACVKGWTSELQLLQSQRDLLLATKVASEFGILADRAVERNGNHFSEQEASINNRIDKLKEKIRYYKSQSPENER
jgi:hypothetical protein